MGRSSLPRAPDPTRPSCRRPYNLQALLSLRGHYERASKPAGYYATAALPQQDNPGIEWEGCGSVGWTVLQLCCYHSNQHHLQFRSKAVLSVYNLECPSPFCTSQPRTPPLICPLSSSAADPYSMSSARLTPWTIRWSCPPTSAPHSGQRARSMGIPHSPMAN